MTDTPDTYELPNGWRLVRDDDPESEHPLHWYLCNPEGVWVTGFWDGPDAGAMDAARFARAMNHPDHVLIPIEPTDAMLEAMEEMYMPFGEMRAAYDGLVMAVARKE